MNKYKSFMFVMFFLSVFLLGQVNASLNDYTLLGKCIYLDAGQPGYLLNREV